MFYVLFFFRFPTQQEQRLRVVRREITARGKEEEGGGAGARGGGVKMEGTTRTQTEPTAPPPDRWYRFQQLSNKACNE